MLESGNMQARRIDTPSTIYIADSQLPGAGRGVFAKDPIPEGALIESCPVVLLPDRRDRDRLRKTRLVNYYFLWGEGRDCAAICLGWGSVYNHSYSPNARYEKMVDDERMDFYALRNLQAGEEITVNYNGAPDDIRPLRIPGIPANAGGMGQASGASWLINGARRRLRTLLATMAKR